MAGPYTFSTACSLITTLPWTETFEVTSGTLNCWTVVDANSDSDYWTVYNSSSYAHSGNQAYRIYTDYNAGVNNDYLISPQITLTGHEQMRFYYGVHSCGDPNDFRVLFSTGSNDPASFTNTLLPLAQYSNTAYQQITINISSYTGPVYLAFHVPSGGADGWYLYIDDVVVETIPTCPTPIALSVASQTDSQATLSWQEFGSATQWQIQYGASGFTLGTGNVVSFVGTNPYILSGLTASSTYDYYVRSYCGGVDYSAWAGPYTFTTECGVITPVYNEAFTVFLPNCWSKSKGYLEHHLF